MCEEKSKQMRGGHFSKMSALCAEAGVDGEAAYRLHTHSQHHSRLRLVFAGANKNRAVEKRFTNVSHSNEGRMSQQE
jgi:hypothetical protein